MKILIGSFLYRAAHATFKETDGSCWELCCV